MIDLLLFLDKADTLKLCVAWTRSQDPEEISMMTGISPRHIRTEIVRMQRLGILLEDGQLDEHVGKYIQQTVVNKIKSENPT